MSARTDNWQELQPGVMAATSQRTMLLTSKRRLNPDKRQWRDIKAYLDQERNLYNAALEQRIEAYRKVNGAKFELQWGVYKTRDGEEAEGYVRRRISDGHAGNRRRLILAAVLTEPLALAQKLDMLDRIDPIKPEVAEDFAAFYAGRADLPTVLTHDLLFAPPNARHALTRGRLQVEIRRRWRASKAGLSAIDQSRELTVLRADDPEYGNRQRRVQRNELNKLQKTFEAMWRGGGYPKFKGWQYFNSFGFDAYQQITYEGGRLRAPKDSDSKKQKPSVVGGRLRFAGMAGGLRVMKDRPLPEVIDEETGKPVTRIKNVWFKAEDRCGDRINRCFVGFQAEAPCAERRPKGKTTGVDWGTSVLAALPTGETIANPRFGEQAAKALARTQRNVSRGVKGSKRRAKTLRHKRAIERKTANRRRTYLDKFSKRLATQYIGVAVETFPIKGLMNAERVGEKLPKFVKTARNRKVLDTAPYLLRQMTDYKTTLYGAELRTVDPTMLIETPLRNGRTSMQMAQPTQRCSMCGLFHYKEQTEAEHICTTPGVFYRMRLPRKVNAARNIEQIAFGNEIWSLADQSRGGPVPGGAAQSANGGTSLRRLGKTESGQPLLGRRTQRVLPSHTHGPAPRPPPGRLRTEPS